MATIVVTGGTGMIGTKSIPALVEKGYEVIVLTRKLPAKAHAKPGVQFALWDPSKGEIDQSAITKADYIIHLAGANVAEKRWSDKRKKEIVDSRVKSGELLVSALRGPNKLKAIVSSSAIGWYGPDPVVPNPRPFREDAPADQSFLGQTCYQWEHSLAPVAAMGKRLVFLRTGIVLGEEGGALEEFNKPLKFRVATILGNGRQVISWIHIDDVVRIYIAAIENENLDGIYNAVAPSPVTNKELITALAKAKGGFYIPMHVPSFVLRTVMGEMSVEVLKSATVSAEKILSTGFKFSFPEIAGALKSLADK